MDNEKDALDRRPPFAKKEYVLVRFCRDWADEFDVDGFAVFEKTEWLTDIIALKKATAFNDYYFGTNEGWESDDWQGVDGWVNSYSVSDISCEAFEVLKSVFGDKHGCVEFGTFPWPQDIIAHASVEEIEGDVFPEKLVTLYEVV